jgi:hypothetical protein
MKPEQFPVNSPLCHQNPQANPLKLVLVDPDSQVWLFCCFFVFVYLSAGAPTLLGLIGIERISHFPYSICQKQFLKIN